MRIANAFARGPDGEPRKIPRVRLVRARTGALFEREELVEPLQEEGTRQVVGGSGGHKAESKAVVASEWPTEGVPWERRRLRDRACGPAPPRDGDLFGERQSGMPTFKVADPLRDEELSEVARAGAERLLAEDATLSWPEHRRMQETLRRQLWEGAGVVSGGVRGQVSGADWLRLIATAAAASGRVLLQR